MAMVLSVATLFSVAVFLLLRDCDAVWWMLSSSRNQWMIYRRLVIGYWTIPQSAISTSPGHSL